MTENINTKNYKKLFNPSFKPDLIHEQRQRVLNNFHKRYAPHMESYYYCKRVIIQETSKDIFEKIEKMLKDPETALNNKIRVDQELWNEYWYLIELDGFRKDEFTMLKERIDYEAIIEEYQQKLNTFSYQMIFKFPKYLFSDGAVNIILGGMGSGKSNLALSMALDTMSSGNYELITNLGIKENYINKYNDIHYVTSFKEVLMIVSRNQIQNMQFIDEGLNHKVKKMICIIDEGEQLFQAGDDHGKELKNFNLITQFFRKLRISMTLIYHRWGDVPKKIRDSASLNCKIFKNMDLDGKPMELGLDKALLNFPSRNKTIILEGIEATPFLISDWQSVFIMEDFENFPEKSVNMKYLLRLGLDSTNENLPERILNELEREKLEYFSIERLTKEIERIERISRGYKIFCDKKTEYFEFVKSQVETEYKILSANNIKGLVEKIKSIVYRNWVLDDVEEKQKKKKLGSVNYIGCDFNTLFLLLQSKTNKEIKEITNETKRPFDENEYKELLKYGISQQKLLAIFGKSKEVLEGKQKIKIKKKD